MRGILVYKQLKSSKCKRLLNLKKEIQIVNQNPRTDKVFLLGITEYLQCLV